MLSFNFLHHKKTTPKQRGLLLIIFIFKYLVFIIIYWNLIVQTCTVKWLTVIRIS